MKKIFLFGMACSLAGPLWGQGTVHLSPGAFVRSTGNAYLVLHNQHLVNDGSLKQAPGEGTVKLTGTENVTLAGSGITFLDRLQLAKGGASLLGLQSNIGVAGQVQFSGGLLDLGNQVLNLESTGVFAGESESSRAYTTGSGYVQATGTLNQPLAVNLGNLGAVITAPTNLGNTTVRRGHLVQAIGPGPVLSIERYFDIVPTNNKNLKATLRVHYFDAELNGHAEGALQQWKSKDNTTWELEGWDTRDGTANFVERNNYSMFHRVTLGAATAPVISCPPDITVSANQNGCKASVSFAATASGAPAPLITYRIGNSVITSPHVFKGVTTVTATAANGIGPAAVCSFTVTVVCGAVTTMAPSERAPLAQTAWTLSAWPNPSEQYFILELKSADERPVRLRVFDAVGRLVEARSSVAPNGTITIGHHYRPGVYFVEGLQGGAWKRLTLIKRGE